MVIMAMVAMMAMMALMAMAMLNFYVVFEGHFLQHGNGNDGNVAHGVNQSLRPETLAA